MAQEKRRTAEICTGSSTGKLRVHLWDHSAEDQLANTEWGEKQSFTATKISRFQNLFTFSTGTKTKS